MRNYFFKKSADNSGKELTNKLALTALKYYLEERDRKLELIAISALAMFLNSKQHKNSAVIIAQAALALHLFNDPDSLQRPMQTYKSVTPVNSAWGNKYFMMRQLPVRKF